MSKYVKKTVTVTFTCPYCERRIYKRLNKELWKQEIAPDFGCADCGYTFEFAHAYDLDVEVEE